MSGGYWIFEVDDGRGDADFDCVYASTASEARDRARRRHQGREPASAPEEVEMTWFHYEPVVARPRAMPGGQGASLREQFFNGGRIGCEAAGLEFMFAPDLFPEPRDEMRDGEITCVYGHAVLAVKGRPDIRLEILLEGLDDAHLIDRLSFEVATAVGRIARARQSPCEPGQGR